MIKRSNKGSLILTSNDGSTAIFKVISIIVSSSTQTFVRIGVSPCGGLRFTHTDNIGDVDSINILRKNDRQIFMVHTMGYEIIPMEIVGATFVDLEGAFMGVDATREGKFLLTYGSRSFPFEAKDFSSLRLIREPI